MNCSLNSQLLLIRVHLDCIVHACVTNKLRVHDNFINFSYTVVIVFFSQVGTSYLDKIGSFMHVLNRTVVDNCQYILLALLVVLLILALHYNLCNGVKMVPIISEFILKL